MGRYSRQGKEDGSTNVTGQLVAMERDVVIRGKNCRVSQAMQCLGWSTVRPR